jgi:hypothetical protein
VTMGSVQQIKFSVFVQRYLFHYLRNAGSFINSSDLMSVPIDSNVKPLLRHQRI